MSEFFHMGGYAAYVWSSYAIAGLCLAASYFVSHIDAVKQVKQIKGKWIREQELVKQQLTQGQDEE